MFPTYSQCSTCIVRACLGISVWLSLSFFAQAALAQNPLCDVVTPQDSNQKTLTFTEFNQVIRFAVDSNSDGETRVCLRGDSRVQQAASDSMIAIYIERHPNVHITTVDSNQYAYLFGSMSVYLSPKFKLSNIVLYSSRPGAELIKAYRSDIALLDKVSLFSNAGQALSFTLGSVGTISNLIVADMSSTTEPKGLEFYGAGIGSISAAKFYYLSTRAQAIRCTHCSIGSISNISLSNGEYGLNLASTSVGSIRQISATNVRTSIAAWESHIGSIQDAQLLVPPHTLGGGTATYGIKIASSSLSTGYVGAIKNVTARGLNGGVPIFLDFLNITNIEDVNISRSCSSSDSSPSCLSAPISINRAVIAHMNNIKVSGPGTLIDISGTDAQSSFVNFLSNTTLTSTIAQPLGGESQIMLKQNVQKIVNPNIQ